MTQRELGRKLKRPHIFVHKTETGDRRIDPVEFIAWCRACGMEQLSQAEAAFLRARELDPTVIRAHLGLAKVSLARSDPGDALRHLERALELKPQQGEVHSLLVLLVP